MGWPKKRYVYILFYCAAFCVLNDDDIVYSHCIDTYWRVSYGLLASQNHFSTALQTFWPIVSCHSVWITRNGIWPVKIPKICLELGRPDLN